MSTNLLGELAANNGTYFLTDSETIYQGSVDQVIVRTASTVLTRVQLFVGEGDDQQDVTSEYLYAGIETKLVNGTRITPKGDHVFSAVKLVDIDGFGGLELVLS